MQDQGYCLITCGGTIDKTGRNWDQLLEVGKPFAPEFLANENWPAPALHIEAMRLDSLAMDDAARSLLAQACDGCGFKKILITHGTDTLDLTCSFLAEHCRKDLCVIATGSMVPGRIDCAHAGANIAFALGLLCAPDCPPGVRLAIQGRVFPAGTFKKNRAKKLFESF